MQVMLGEEEALALDQQRQELEHKAVAAVGFVEATASARAGGLPVHVSTKTDKFCTMVRLPVFNKHLP